MRSTLILLAIALSLFLGLAMGAALMAGPGLRAFTIPEQNMVRERWSGGSFMDNGTVYRTCENGYEVRRYADGRVLWFPQRACWK